MNVLYIDDDKEDIELFFDALQVIDPNIPFLSVNDCPKALEILKENVFKPDIIFLDINMPLMSGIDCLKALKRDAKLRHIPVVIYSTHVRPGEVEMCKNLGCHSYLVKPAKFDVIVSSIKKILQSVL
jgi:CheY-like chemotaxis protein